MEHFPYLNIIDAHGINIDDSNADYAAPTSSETRINTDLKLRINL